MLVGGFDRPGAAVLAFDFQNAEMIHLSLERLLDGLLFPLACLMVEGHDRITHLEFGDRLELILSRG